MELKKISIDEIELRPGNPRTEILAGSLEKLERSLKRDGFIQPIVVRQKGSKYELIVGERRVRAAMKANIPKIEVLVRDNLTDTEADRLRLIENLQRDELTFLERVKGIEAHMQHHGMRTVRDAAVDLNLDPEAVEGWFSVAKNIPQSILDKPDYVRRLGLQKFREIQGFDDATVSRLAEQIYNSDLTVDQVRRFVGLFKSNPDADLLTLANKSSQQVKTIEVTLPIEEAEELERKVKKLRETEFKASKKLEKIKKKPKGRDQIDREIMEESAVSQGMKHEKIPISGFSIEKLRDRQISSAIVDARLTTEEVKLVSLLKKQYPRDTAAQLVERVKEKTRVQPMVIEWNPDLYQALKKYAKSRSVDEKRATVEMVEDSLAQSGFWQRTVGR